MDVESERKSQIDLKVLTCSTGRLELPFTETGKSWAEQGLAWVDRSDGFKGQKKFLFLSCTLASVAKETNRTLNLLPR